MSAIETMADWDEATELGRARPDLAWVATDRDVWHRNLAYTGPEQPHPEDDDAHDYIAEHGIDAWRAARLMPSPITAADADDGLVF